MNLNREQLIRELAEDKKQTIRKWKEIVEKGFSDKYCGYCNFKETHTELKGIEGKFCRTCPISCYPVFGEWYENRTKEKAQAVLDVVSDVDVKAWIDKLLEAEKAGDER